MAIEYNFTLDMDRSKRDNNIAYARTGDMDSITINADLVFGGAAYTPSGTNAFFECITPNGRSVRASAEKTGSSVSVEVPSAAFQAAGVINVAYFRFESGASDNPTYVESTEPFAIVVREGVGDNIDAGDYIEEWRKLADQLEAAVAEVEKKAEQAETAINEQKTEVDQLKVQAQKAIAGDVTEVEGAAQSAIAAINQEKADVADAADGITEAGEQAINSFNSKGTSAINKFNIDGTSAINQFNTNAGSKLDEVDGMITEAQGDVDAAITQLETATGKAVSAMEDALDGTTAGSLQNAINRTLKLDIADMVNIPDNSSLSSFTNIGSYCCKTAATAATVGDCPIDDSPFNMYVFSSVTSGQVMQLVVPIDLNGKPTAEWHVRFGTSSAMDPWSVIGGGADIAAGLGIDVTGDAKKTVALDTTAFYQHHEAASIIQGSTEVTGGGRIKKLTVYGQTRQNLWVNPSGTSNGVTVTSNDDGSMSISGTANNSIIFADSYSLSPGKYYRVLLNKNVANIQAFAIEMKVDESSIDYVYFGGTYELTNTFKFNESAQYSRFVPIFSNGATYDASGIRVMLREATEEEVAAAQQTASTLQEGGTADLSQDLPVTLQTYPDVLADAQPFDWVKPGINGAEPMAINASGKNLCENLPGICEFSYGYPFFAESKNKAIEPSDLPVTIDSSAAAGMACVFHFKAGQSITFSCGNAPTGTTMKYSLQYNYKDDIEVFSFNPVGIDIPACSNNMGLSPFTLSPGFDGWGVFMVSKPEINHGESIFGVDFWMQIELGTEATAYEPPSYTSAPLDLKGHQLYMLPDGTRDELRIDGTGAASIEQSTYEYTIDGHETFWVNNQSAKTFGILLPIRYPEGNETNAICEKLPVRPLSQDTRIGVRLSNNRSSSVVVNVGKDSADDVKAWFSSNPTKIIIPVESPQTISLGSIAMPDLASPDYIVYASSNIPAETEADVVKVDYLPASDVYTREEVDRKIEDAGMPAVVPVSKGGTGVTTAAAERNRLGLGNTTGALPVANGGTGKTTVKAAQNALLVDIDTVSTDVGDDSFFAGYYQSPSDATGALYKRSASTIWNWIVSKIRSTFGFNSSNVLPVSHGGTGLTKAPSMLVNLESASAANPLASDPRPGVSGELPLTSGGTGATSAAAARTNLGVYSKVEVDGKVPKVVYGTGNIPSNAENGTIYIQYRS